MVGWAGAEGVNSLVPRGWIQVYIGLIRWELGDSLNHDTYVLFLPMAISVSYSQYFLNFQRLIHEKICAFLSASFFTVLAVYIRVQSFVNYIYSAVMYILYSTICVCMICRNLIWACRVWRMMMERDSL